MSATEDLSIKPYMFEPEPPYSILLCTVLWVPPFSVVTCILAVTKLHWPTSGCDFEIYVWGMLM